LVVVFLDNLLRLVELDGTLQGLSINLVVLKISLGHYGHFAALNLPLLLLLDLLLGLELEGHVTSDR
jgi:hypothetical protein